MAIKLKDIYPGRTIIDGGNPFGTFKNSDPPGSLNGTPGDNAWARDMWSFLEILMSEGSVTYSGAPDDATASQRYDALVKIARDVWPLWDAAHEYSAGVITVGSDDNPYYSLQASNTNHDPVSNPAWWSNFSYETLQTDARTIWPLWDAAETYPQGVGTVGSDGKPYFSLQASNFNHNPTSSPTWWNDALIFDATKSSKGILFLGDQRIILSNNSIDPTNDIDFSVGRFTFDDGTGQAISAPYTKQLDATFVAGNNQGGLDTGSIADNTWYHCFAIYNPANGLSDYIFSTNATSPTMSSGYTKKRRIWAIRRQLDPITPIAQRIEPFFQSEKECTYKTRINDVDDSGNIGNTAVLAVITTPLGVKTWAKIYVGYTVSSAQQIILTSPDEVDIAPDLTLLTTLNTAGERADEITMVRTNTSSEIRRRSSAITVIRFVLTTLGYIDYTLED